MSIELFDVGTGLWGSATERVEILSFGWWQETITKTEGVQKVPACGDLLPEEHT